METEQEREKQITKLIAFCGEHVFLNPREVDALFDEMAMSNDFFNKIKGIYDLYQSNPEKGEKAILNLKDGLKKLFIYI
jgi:hypothetical protein